MKNIHTKQIAIITGLLLMIPLVLSVLSVGGWKWGVLDFVAMGVLLFGTGCALDFARQKITKPMPRILVCVCIVTTLLLIWAELAVDAVSKTVQLLT